MGIPKFNEEDLKDIHKYLADWNKWREKKKIGFLDYTDYNIMLLPLTISLLKSQSRLNKLTYTLIFLTIILAIETLVLLFYNFCQNLNICPKIPLY